MFPFFVVVASYMMLLVGLSIASPGIGFTGSLINLVPGAWRDGAHVPAYGLLAWLVMLGFRRRGWPLSYALFVGIACAVVFGLWTEVAQGLAPGREASLHDLLNDLLGAMMAGTLMIWHHTTQFRWCAFASTMRMNLFHLRKGTLRR